MKGDSLHYRIGYMLLMGDVASRYKPGRYSLDCVWLLEAPGWDRGLVGLVFGGTKYRVVNGPTRIRHVGA